MSHRLESKQLRDRTVTPRKYSSGDASHLYSGGGGFESWSGLHLGTFRGFPESLQTNVWIVGLITQRPSSPFFNSLQITLSFDNIYPQRLPVPLNEPQINKHRPTSKLRYAVKHGSFILKCLIFIRTITRQVNLAGDWDYQRVTRQTEYPSYKCKQHENGRTCILGASRCVTQARKMSKTYQIAVWKLKGNRPLKRSKHRWQGNIKSS